MSNSGVRILRLNMFIFLQDTVAILTVNGVKNARHRKCKSGEKCAARRLFYKNFKS